MPCLRGGNFYQRRENMLPPSGKSNDISSRRKSPIHCFCRTACRGRLATPCNCEKIFDRSIFFVRKKATPRSIDLTTYLILRVQIPWLSSGNSSAPVNSKRTGRKSTSWRDAVSRCMSHRFSVFTGAMPSRISCDTIETKQDVQRYRFPNNH